MKRRFVAIATALAMSVGACTGSTSSPTTSSVPSAEPSASAQSSAPAEPVTLTFWSLQQSAADIKAAQEAAIADFEQANNVTVELITYPYVELQDKLLLAASSGAAPDILLLDQIWVAQYAGAGYVDPIDDLMAGAGIKPEDYFEGAWDSGFYQGKQYTVPFDVGVWAVMYYNKQMFRDAGLDPEKPPATWDELNAAGAALTKDDKYGIATWVGPGDAANCLWDAWTYSGGGQVVDAAANTAGLASPAGIAALQQYKDTLAFGPDGAVARNVEDAFTLFTSGQAAIMFYGEWGQDTIKAKAPDMDYGVALLPAPAGGTSVGCFGGFNLGISSNSEHKDVAWKFIEYASGFEKQHDITQLTPAHAGAAEEYLQAKRLYPEVIHQQLSQAQFRPLIPSYPDFAEVQRIALDKALLGEASPQEAVDEILPQLNDILSQ